MNHWEGNPFEEESLSDSCGSGKMVKTFQAYLPNCHRTYSCVHCRAHLANHDELISKVIVFESSRDVVQGRDHLHLRRQSFQGSQGRAYLFNSV